MAIEIDEIFKANSCRLLIWKMDEPLEILTSLANKFTLNFSGLELITNPIRKKEFLVIRLLLHSVSKDLKICYDDYGKPHLENSNFHISISHTENFVALLVDEKESTGIDIQTINHSAIKIRDKFLSENEKSFITVNDEIHHSMAWCAKETLYKIYGKKNLIFTNNLLLEPFKPVKETIIQAKIVIDEYCESFQLLGDFNKDYVIVFKLNK